MSLADAIDIFASAERALLSDGPMPWKARVLYAYLSNKMLCQTEVFETHIVECHREKTASVCKYGEQEDCDRIAAICDEMDELLSIIKYIDEPKSAVVAGESSGDDTNGSGSGWRVAVGHHVKRFDWVLVVSFWLFATVVDEFWWTPYAIGFVVFAYTVLTLLFSFPHALYRCSECHRQNGPDDDDETDAVTAPSVIAEG